MDSQKLKEKVGSGSNSPDPEKGVIVPSKTERMFDGFTKVDIYAPATGIIVDQKDIPDKDFAEGHMGQGFGIEPFIGHFHAFVTGTLEIISKTENAYIIRPKDTELSVLMQVGIDTDEIPEELGVFRSLLEEGVFVNTDKELCNANLDIIREQGKSTITPLFVQNEGMEFKKIIYHKKPGDKAIIGELIMSIVRDDG